MSRIRHALFEWLRAAYQRIPSWLIRLRPFTVFEVSIPSNGSPKRGVEGVEFAWAELDDLDRIAAIAAPSCIEGWDPRCCRALVAWLNHQPISILWVATGQFDEDELGVTFRLSPDQAWLFAAFTHATFRGRGVYQCLLAFLLNALEDEGYDQLLFGITYGNVASQRAHEKFGMRQVGTVVAIQMFRSIFVTWVSGAVVRCASRRRLAFGASSLQVTSDCEES